MDKAQMKAEQLAGFFQELVALQLLTTPKY